MTSDPVGHALSYPFEIPTRSFVVADGRYAELADSEPLPDLAGRRPVLALGSNQSPAQLIRKFKDRGLGPIPVIRARLRDFDIVYSAHVAAYGSIPATLRHCRGAAVTLFVNCLDPAQEARMHETETASGNYRYGRLDGVALRMEVGGDLASVHVYISSRGALARNGAPVALAAVEAENRRWPSLAQREVQAHVRDRVAPGEALDSFVRSAIDDASVRKARTEAMASTSFSFSYGGFTALDL